MSDTYYLLSKGPFHTIIEAEGEFVKLRFAGHNLWIGDDYHKMNELYDHRMMLFTVLMNERAGYSWKSKLHADGTMFEGGWFISGYETPKGMITYHLKIDPYWDLMNYVAELDKAPEWDGHTSADVLERLKSL